jgi:hypothetical protein
MRAREWVDERRLMNELIRDYRDLERQIGHG